MSETKNTYFLIGIAILVLALFAFTSLWIVGTRIGNYANSDFFSFWLASKMTWEGQNPLDENLWIEGHVEYGATWISDNTFLYPPGLSVILAPLGTLSLFEAFTSWVFISQILVVFSLVIMVVMFVDKSSTLQYLVPIAAGVFLYRPLLVTLMYGQLGSFFLLLMVLALYALRKEKCLLSGLLIGVICFKPNIGFILNLLMGFYSLFTRRWRLLIGQILGVLAIFIISELRVPGWLGFYIDILQHKGGQALGYCPTIWGIADLLCGSKPDCLIWLGSFLSIAMLIFVLLIIHKSKDWIAPYTVFMLAITTMAVTTPYLWGYDLLYLLIPVVVLALDHPTSEWPYLIRASLMLLFSLISALLVYVGAYLGRDTASSLLGLLALSVLIWFYIKKQANTASVLYESN